MVPGRYQGNGLKCGVHFIFGLEKVSTASLVRIFLSLIWAIYTIQKYIHKMKRVKNIQVLGVLHRYIDIELQLQENSVTWLCVHRGAKTGKILACI